MNNGHDEAERKMGDLDENKQNKVYKIDHYLHSITDMMSENQEMFPKNFFYSTDLSIGEVLTANTLISSR